jgi:hypothetical protein
MNDENAHPNGAVPAPPGHQEFGLHVSIKDAPPTNGAIAAVAADVMRVGVSMGLAVVVMMVDPNKATVKHAWTSTPEMEAIVDDVKRPGGQLVPACKKATGELPFLMERDNSKKSAGKKRRSTLRKATFKKALQGMKLLYGSLPNPAQTSDTLATIEEEFRRYHARGNRIPVGIRRYLANDPEREVKDALPEEGSAAPAHLRDHVPFPFNPMKPSKLMRALFNLQKDKETKGVKTKPALTDAQLTKKQATAARNFERIKVLADAAGLTVGEYTKGARGRA